MFAKVMKKTGFGNIFSIGMAVSAENYTTNHNFHCVGICAANRHQRKVVELEKEQRRKVLTHSKFFLKLINYADLRREILHCKREFGVGLFGFVGGQNCC